MNGATDFDEEHADEAGDTISHWPGAEPSQLTGNGSRSPAASSREFTAIRPGVSAGQSGEEQGLVPIAAPAPTKAGRTGGLPQGTVA